MNYAPSNFMGNATNISFICHLIAPFQGKSISIHFPLKKLLSKDKAEFGVLKPVTYIFTGKSHICGTN